jgi:hypothetical protein
MQTGQNSIAPESSLPQLGQVRWDSEFMDLTTVQPQFEPKATPRIHRVRFGWPKATAGTARLQLRRQCPFAFRIYAVVLGIEFCLGFEVTIQGQNQYVA